MSEMTGTLLRMPDVVLCQPLCFVPSADLHVVTLEAQTRSEWLLLVRLNM